MCFPFKESRPLLSLGYYDSAQTPRISHVEGIARISSKGSPLLSASPFPRKVRKVTISRDREEGCSRRPQKALRHGVGRSAITQIEYENGRISSPLLFCFRSPTDLLRPPKVARRSRFISTQMGNSILTEPKLECQRRRGQKGASKLERRRVDMSLVDAVLGIHAARGALEPSRAFFRKGYLRRFHLGFNLPLPYAWTLVALVSACIIRIFESRGEIESARATRASWALVRPRRSPAAALPPPSSRPQLLVRQTTNAPCTTHMLKRGRPACRRRRPR